MLGLAGIVKYTSQSGVRVAQAILIFRSAKGFFRKTLKKPASRAGGFFGRAELADRLKKRRQVRLANGEFTLVGRFIWNIGTKLLEYFDGLSVSLLTFIVTTQ